ncbi:hypothetical protein ACHAXT_009807 [Thalassiosira profunda]
MKASTITAGLLLLSVGTDGFGAVPQRLCRPRSRAATLPPLFYTDIEPEIRSATIPPVIHFNGTTIHVHPAENGARARGSTTSRTSGGQATAPIPDVESDDAKPRTKRKSKSPKSHVTTWQTRYQELLTYKNENGHCLVPQNYSANRRLGLWVMQQRRQYTLQQTGRSSSFDGPGGAKRVQLLEDIGFVWRVLRRGPRDAYGSLRRMKQLADSRSTGDEVVDAANFETYLIEKSEDLSDDDIRAAWRRRFEIFQ